jgi:hypothetical protein
MCLRPKVPRKTTRSTAWIFRSSVAVCWRVGAELRPALVVVLREEDAEVGRRCTVSFCAVVGEEVDQRVRQLLPHVLPGHTVRRPYVRRRVALAETTVRRVGVVRVQRVDDHRRDPPSRVGCERVGELLPRPAEIGRLPQPPVVGAHVDRVRVGLRRRDRRDRRELTGVQRVLLVVVGGAGRLARRPGQTSPLAQR